MANFITKTLFVAFFLLNSTPLVNAQAGGRFITSVCTSDAGCDSGCCGFKSGKCAGPIIAQERDGGCGFGDAQPNDTAARKLRGGAAAAPAATTLATIVVPKPASTAAPVSKAPGTQFITGVCASDADCASACCGFKSGKCAGPVIAQERDGGCGFGDAAPNDDAARAFRGGAPAAPVPAAAPQKGTPGSTAAAPGKQFITGVCTADADCASSCCGFKSGKCAGPIVAQERDGGCGFGNAVPNDTAAKALTG